MGQHFLYYLRQTILVLFISVCSFKNYDKAVQKNKNQLCVCVWGVRTSTLLSNF